MKKPVLILENQAPENSAYLLTWLKSKDILYCLLNSSTVKEFPSSIEPYSALAIMGGDISANDMVYTSRQAEILILQAIRLDIPVIGHCLGGQLMAKALGGTITKSTKPEIGWQSISYVNNDLVTEWFGDSPTDKVMHWHYDTFSIPEGATLLASTEACPNQAFSYGKHLAMQFHIEVDENKVNYWVEDKSLRWKNDIENYDTVQEKFQMLNGIKPYLSKHQATANKVYTNWLKTTVWGNSI